MSILPMSPQPGWENIPGDGSYGEYVMRARMTPQEYEEWKRRPPAPASEPFPEMRPQSPGLGYVPRVIIGPNGQQSQDWAYSPPKDPWIPQGAPMQPQPKPQPWGPGQGAPWQGFFGQALGRAINRPGAAQSPNYGALIGRVNEVLGQRGSPWWQQILQRVRQRQPQNLATLNQPGYRPW